MTLDRTEPGNLDWESIALTITQTSLPKLELIEALPKRNYFLFVPVFWVKEGECKKTTL